MIKNYSRAFTIVEMLVVISIVAILSTLAVITFNSVRQESRDAARKSNATIIGEALEKYYEKNGEYPSVASIVKEQAPNTGQAVASKLAIPATSLVNPNTPPTQTNALTSNAEPEEDFIAYVSADSDPLCQTDPNGGCDEYTLKFHEETTGEFTAVESRRSSREFTLRPELSLTVGGSSSINTSWSPVLNATSYELQRSLSSDFTSPITTTHTGTSSAVTGLAANTEYFFRVRAVQPETFSDWSDTQSESTNGLPAPSGTITIAAAMSGTNARGTAGGGTCQAGSTLQYQIRYQLNAGTWSTYVVGSPRDVAATEGNTYTFQAQARCTAGGNNGPWATSATAAISAPVTAPTGITVTAAMSGTNARGTGAGGTCATGTTIERQIRYQINAGAYVAYTTASYRDVAATEGYTYTFQQQARCVGTNTSSGWVASATGAITRPVTAPASLTMSAAMSGTNARGTAAGGACASGVTLERQIRYQINTDAYVAYTTASYRDVAATEGYRYTFQQQARCNGTNADSAWVASSTASVVRPVATPAAPGLTVSTSGSISTWTGSGTCPAGTTRTFERTSQQQGGAWTGWTGTTTATTSTWDTSAQGYTYYRAYRMYCNGLYADSAWVQGPTVSYTRPITTPTVTPATWTHVSLGWQNEANCKYYAGCKFRRFNWTLPACPAGTVYYSSAWNSYVGTKMSWDNGQGQTYRWWQGYSTTSTTSDSVAYTSAQNSHIVEYSSNVPAGYDYVRHKLILTCRNSTTGVTDASESYSQLFLYM